MNLNLPSRSIGALTGAGLLAAAGAAQAFQPAGFESGDILILQGGATASNISFRNAVVDTACDPAFPIDSGQTASDIEDARHWWVACRATPSTIPDISAPQDLLFVKRNPGGSGVGVAPVSEALAIGFLVPEVGAGTNCPDGVDRVETSPGGRDVNVFVCNEDNIEPRIPLAGSSDIEPAKFFALNRPQTDLDLDGVLEPQGDDFVPDFNSCGNLNVNSVANLTFGVVVNDGLYQALQRAQFPQGHARFAQCNPAGNEYGDIKTLGDNASSEQCMPTLASQEIRSIFSSGGKVSDWSQLQVESPLGSGAFVTLTSLGTTTSDGSNLDDTAVQICRRVEGSGTQAQLNAIFVGWPCDLNADGSIDTLQPEVERPVFFGAPFVVENPGSSDLGRCLDAFENGIAGAQNQNPDELRRWAIGFQSLEKNPELGRDYHFVKVDGVAPTLANVHAGDYYNFATQSFQWRTAPGCSNGLGDVVAAGSDEELILQGIVDFLRDPATVSLLNTELVHPFGEAGWLAQPTAANPPDATLDPSRPVAVYERVSFAGNLNTCALPSASELAPALTVQPYPCEAVSDFTGDEAGPANCYVTP